MDASNEVAPPARLQVNDRVLVVRNGQTVKGRIKEVSELGATVTTSKEDEGSFHAAEAVIPLYRYVEAGQPIVTYTTHRQKVGLLPAVRCGY